MSTHQDDLNRLTALYREIQEREADLHDASMQFSSMVRDIALKLGVPAAKVCDMIGESHDG